MTQPPKKMVVHCKKDVFDVYIGRPSKWGNPFSHKKDTLAKYKCATHQESIEKYSEWLLGQEDLLRDIYELKGKVLGCWCDPQECHSHILAAIANIGE